MPDPKTQADIEALADQLSQCADELHARLMRAIRHQPPTDGTADPSGTPGISKDLAQALFENEMALRQRANGLYLEAARLAASGLGSAQQQVLEVTIRAGEKIRQIDRFKDLLDLTAELLSLGAAVASGKAERIVTPLENLKHHIDAL